MKRLAPLLLLCAFLMGQESCEEVPPELVGYCAGNDYSIWDSVVAGYERDGFDGAYSTIIGGEPSDNRRSTVQIRFGSSYCSGVVLAENLVLTAGHCGYGDATEHNVYLPTRKPGSDFVDLEGPFKAAKHVVHPDYLEWVANPVLLNKREADLMILIMEDHLPPPYVGINFYQSNAAKICRGLVAQGLGRWEGSGLSLREAKYQITNETARMLRSKNTEAGKICYGDSGGPLYADVAGQILLAGITSTTMSTDCLAGGSHVKASEFQPWVIDVIRTELLPAGAHEATVKEVFQ